MATAKQVHVQMIDGLPTIRTGVDDNAVPLLQTFRARNFSSGPQQVTEESGLRLIRVRE